MANYPANRKLIKTLEECKGWIKHLKRSKKYLHNEENFTNLLKDIKWSIEYFQINNPCN